MKRSGNKRRSGWWLLLVVAVFSPLLVSGGSLYISPSGGSWEVGDSWQIEVMVESEEPVNAFTGVVEFDELLGSLQINTENSLVDFWAVEPQTEDRETRFDGVMVGDHFEGDEGLLWTAEVEALQAGTTTVGFADGSVHAYDGHGSEVTEELREAVYVITEEEEPVEPQIATLPVQEVTADSAYLRGELQDMGTADEVEVFFRWRPEGEDWRELPGELREEAGVFSGELEGLEEDTVYQAVAVVQWEDEERQGDIEDFTTALTPPPEEPEEPEEPDDPEDPEEDPTAPGRREPRPEPDQPEPDQPEIITRATREITTESAYLRGELRDMGTADELEVFFRWRPRGEDWQDLPSELRDETGLFGTELQELEEGSSYQVVAMAEWEGQEWQGGIREFTTEVTLPPDPDEPDDPDDPEEEPAVPVEEPEQPEEPAPGTAAETVRDGARAAERTVRRTLEQPAGRTVSRVVTTGGVAAGGLLMFLVSSASQLPFLPLRVWFLILWLLGLRKRHRPWGTVYDSVTKQPLDPAYVVLYDRQDPDDPQEMSITDLDGRYGFLIRPGAYQMEANKTNYAFPSRRLKGHDSDVLYNDLYFGEPIKVKREGEVVTRNIPMDPIDFDWNEYVKGNKKMMRFHNRYDYLLQIIAEVVFWLGLTLAVLVTVITPVWYNILVFAVYMIFIALRLMGFRSMPHGTISDGETGDPLSFAMLRVYMASGHSEQQIKAVVCDAAGKYYCLVAPGYYYYTVEKKNEDGSYTTVYTSPAFNCKKGLISDRIVV